MTYRKYPDNKTVDEFIKKHEPLLIAISFDGETALVTHLDDSVEHHILLAHFGINGTEIDKYFRIVVDDESADWTFVCPKDYKNITDRQKRIITFYNDGMGDDSTYLPY